MRYGIIFTGVKWTAAQIVISTTFAVGKMYILAHYLNPKELGILAIITLSFSFLELASFWGLDSSIYHASKLSKEQISTIFWLYIFFGLILGLLTIGIAPYLAEFYKEESLSHYIRFLGLLLCISSVGKLNFSLKSRELNYKLISKNSFIAESSGVLLSVYLVVNNYGIWGAICGIGLTTIFKYGYFFILGVLQGFSAMHFSLKEALHFLKIGTYTLSASLVSQLSSSFDLILIERLAGLDDLGKYSLAKQLANQPFRFSGPIIQKVFTPYLATMREKKNKLKEKYLMLIKINTLFNFCALMAFLSVSGYLVTRVYGETFREITGLTMLLCVYLFLRTVNSPVMILSVVQGKTQFNLQWSLLQVIVIPPFVLAGSYYGMEGIAIALIVMRIALYYPSWFFFGRRLADVTFKEQFKANIPFRKLKQF